jgi:glycosyltransferase involved in cell wall biosynthesis
MIRTQGQRYELLEEAVRSVTNQPVAMTPCIIVHGELEALYAVEQWARSLALPAVVLHAPDLSKKRGYPINVGLEYLESHADQYDFVCFLDDDDIIYPLYSERLTSAINLSGADIAVGLSNQRELWVAPEAGHRLLPTSALVAGNFIPIHAFIVRTSYLRQTNVRFREDLHYLEDWDFLLQLLAGGGVFETVNEVVCEYRLIGDGNRQVRTRPEEFELCRWRVLARGSFCAQKLGGGRFCRDLAAFDFESRPALAPHEIRQLMDARSLFGIQ